MKEGSTGAAGGNLALVTSDPDSLALACAELKDVMSAAPAVLSVKEGVLALDLLDSFADFAAAVAQRSPIFVRHIAPAQWMVPLSGTESDLTALCSVMEALAPGMERGRSFAVQTRIATEGKQPYREFTANQILSDAVASKTGETLDCREPEQIVSVFCTETIGYVGLSRTAQNRSDWAGGKHRFRREEGQISRAEFKLLEAFDVFKLELPERGMALDMGAAPGGWSRVLCAQGLEVVAVDPAELDSRLKHEKRIHPIRKRIQDFFPSRQTFDVIVNDMRMDALESVAMMLRARRNLTHGGLGILTLKLPEDHSGYDVLGLIHDALRRLSEGYTVLDARQLYHNRSEVTVALRG